MFVSSFFSSLKIPKFFFIVVLHTYRTATTGGIGTTFAPIFLYTFTIARSLRETSLYLYTAPLYTHSRDACAAVQRHASLVPPSPYPSEPT